MDEERHRAIFERYGVASAGAAVIRGGKVVWIGYYGEQSPGVPTSRDTLFNVASITKTVTAELIMRLAAAGQVSLDESMSPHWVDPDLVADARHKQLTPRIALSHRTGFPNWRYMDDESKLRFLADPGDKFGYSGEGFEYVARFVEKKLGKNLNVLMAEHVLRPAGTQDMALSPQIMDGSTSRSSRR